VHDAAAGRVHDHVGHELGHEEGDITADVVHPPFADRGSREASGIGHGSTAVAEAVLGATHQLGA